MRLISIVNYHIFPPNCLSSKFRRIFQLVNLSITIGPDAGNPMMSAAAVFQSCCCCVLVVLLLCFSSAVAVFQSCCVAQPSLWEVRHVTSLPTPPPRAVDVTSHVAQMFPRFTTQGNVTARRCVTRLIQKKTFQCIITHCMIM